MIYDNEGNITALHCTADFATLGKKAEGRKVKGVIHWVSKAHSLPGEVRLYERLFALPNPASASSLAAAINPDSLHTLHGARIEISLQQAAVGEVFQFERQGYFVFDRDTSSKKTVFNRTVTLRDTWLHRL